MRTALCLEYQARAKGKSLSPKSWTARNAVVQAWDIKYRPCLDCAQGQEIAANGEKDDDVEALKTSVTVSNEQTKLCPRCKAHLPKSAFGPHSGNKDGLQCYCRQCQRNIQNESSAKRRAAKDIDQIALNIAPKVDNDAIKTQSISENAKDINYKDIASSMLNTEQNVNKTVESTVESTPCERTCERCGYTGPEDKFHQAGNSGRINICRKCVALNRENNKKLRAQNTIMIGLQDVVLSFADFPEILETLTADAKRNFRTLQNEILFRLVNHAK